MCDVSELQIDIIENENSFVGRYVGDALYISIMTKGCKERRLTVGNIYSWIFPFQMGVHN